MYSMIFLGDCEGGFPSTVKDEWSKMFRGTLQDCLEEFFSCMRVIFRGFNDDIDNIEGVYLPANLGDIDVESAPKCSFETDGTFVIVKFDLNERGRNRFACPEIKIISYATNGGFLSAYSALLIPDNLIIELVANPLVI